MSLSRRKKTDDFELELKILNDDFVSTPGAQQRNAVLNKLMSEYEENIRILDREAAQFVNAESGTFVDDRSNVELTDDEIMEDWQIPLMEAMASIVCESKGDVLEIGFGRGIASEFIQSNNPRSHTIIECNSKLFPRMSDWRMEHSDSEIHFVEGLWQDVIDSLDQYDGIFFHTYPLNSDEYMEYVVGRSTFAEHFFETAARHLRKGGIFSYMTNEVASLSRAQQIALFRHFDSIETKVIKLKLNETVRDSWWSNQMVLVKATK